MAIEDAGLYEDEDVNKSVGIVVGVVEAATRYCLLSASSPPSPSSPPPMLGVTSYPPLTTPCPASYHCTPAPAHYRHALNARMRACAHLHSIPATISPIAASTIALLPILPYTMARGVPGSSDIAMPHHSNNLNDAALSTLFLASPSQALSLQRAIEHGGDHQPSWDKPRMPVDGDRALGHHTEREPPPLHPKERSPRRRRSRSLSSFRTEAPPPFIPGRLLATKSQTSQVTASASAASPAMTVPPAPSSLRSATNGEIALSAADTHPTLWAAAPITRVLVGHRIVPGTTACQPRRP